MSVFKKKTWHNRMVEYPGRRKLTNVNTGDITVVDAERNEGNVITTGDAFNDETMNDQEDRIESAFSEIEVNTYFITLSPSNWQALGNHFIQSTGITTIDGYGVDIQDLSPDTIVSLAEEGTQLIAQNDNGLISIIAIGERPSFQFSLSVKTQREEIHG